MKRILQVEGVGLVVVDVPSTALIDEPLSPASIIPISVTRAGNMMTSMETKPTTMTMTTATTNAKMLPKVSEEIIEEDD